MKVLIRGAGDLATGIASRLFHGGYHVLMTEIAEPLTVRRTVALSRAVYEKEVEVEDLKGVRVETIQQVWEALRQRKIPVIVDEHADICRAFRPDAVVDAILAKKNLGTRMTDAPFVVGVGPGFEAGIDCDCVVETKRGHTLGRVIWQGSAIPNTGIPGNIGGYTTERLLRALAGGGMRPLVSIGDSVEMGQVVAYTGGVPVKAQMAGIVRGMLNAGVDVTEGLKIGDIDARCERTHCFTISDKARAVGGGVLEAISGFEKKNLPEMRVDFSFSSGEQEALVWKSIEKQYAIVVLAAGNSTRFGENKLFVGEEGEKLYQRILRKLEAFPEMMRIIVTRFPTIVKEAQAKGIRVVYNGAPELGISHSLQLGLSACIEQEPELQGILFMVCDQPWLRVRTIADVLRMAADHPGRIICAGSGGQSKNPVVWDRAFFQELGELQGDIGGRQVRKRYPEKILFVEMEEAEGKDVDYPADWNARMS